MSHLFFLTAILVEWYLLSAPTASSLGWVSAVRVEERGGGGERYLKRETCKREREVHKTEKERMCV